MKQHKLNNNENITSNMKQKAKQTLLNEKDSKCNLIASINSKAKMNDSQAEKLAQLGVSLDYEYLNDIFDKVNQKGYNEDKFTELIAEKEDKSNKTATIICEKVCGDKMCKNIKAISGNSPLDFELIFSDKFYETTTTDLFVELNNDKARYFTKYSNIFFYKKGVWKENKDSNEFKALINNVMLATLPHKEVTTSRIKNIVERLKMTTEFVYDKPITQNKDIINLKNGLFDLKENRLKPHTHEHLSFWQLPVAYNPNAQAPLFLKTCREIFSNNDEVIEYFLDFMLYSMIPNYSYQKIFIFIGKGRNGKSLLSKVLSELLGKENIASESISNIATDKGYSVIELKNKLLNVSSESKTNKLDTDILKKLTGQDQMSSRAIYSSRDNFENIAKILLLVNEMPKFRTVDTAMLKRLEIFEFNESFADNPDEYLFDKLLKELPGILNLVLKRVSHLIDGNGNISMSPPKVISDNLNKYVGDIDSVIKFVNEKCILTKDYVYENSSVKLQGFMEEYDYWCNENGLEPNSRHQVKKSLTMTLGLKCENRSYIVTETSQKIKNQDWIWGAIPKDIAEDHLSKGSISAIKVEGQPCPTLFQKVS